MKRAVVLVAAVIFVACGGKPVPAPTPAPPHPQPTPEPTPAPPKAALVDPGMRLPRDVAIESYNLILGIDPSEPTMSGTVTISGKVVRATDVVWLNAEELTIKSAYANVGGHAIQLTPDTSIAKGKLALVAPSPLPVGPVTIQILYSATFAMTITDGTFRQHAGDDWYVFTQHEAITARRSFPCLDEPDSKVPWTLELHVPPSSFAVANAPAESDTVEGAWRTVKFATTEPLPPHLIAYAVGPFDIVDAGKSAGGIPHRILTIRGHAAEAAYAAEIMPKVTSELERYFGMPHPFPKLDSIAIPTTVGFGAMENPGLITYRESLLMLPPDASPVRKSRLLGVTAHEIAHQWFGNLVTPVFWDDLWLNESFASWLPERIVSAIEPSFRRPEDAMAGRDEALSADSIASVRRVHQPIANEGDIVTAFDSITYAKGAAVLRMFERRVGADRFQTGVRNYMAKYGRKNATAADFLAEIDAVASEVGVKDAMSTLLDQPGAPRLTAAITCPASGQPGITVRQSRFLPPGSGKVPVQTWKLPVCVTAGTAKAKESACATISDVETFIPLTACPTWVWPNTGGVGYWRSTLDAAGWNAIRTTGWKHLDASERLAVAYDLFAAINAGELDVGVGLDLVPALVAENNRSAIGAAVGMIERYESWIPTAQRPKFQAWVRKQLGKRAAALGWLPQKGDDIQKDAIRGRIVYTEAVLGNDPKLLKAAVKLAKDWRALPEASRGDILAAAVRAEPALVDTLAADFVAETSRQRRGELARALAYPGDPAKVSVGLKLVADRSLDIRDTIGILTAAAAHDEQRDIVLAFFNDNVDALLAAMPGDMGGGLVAVFASGCDRSTSARRETATAKLGQLRGASRRITQSFERVDQCIARRAVVEPALTAWLAKQR